LGRVQEGNAAIFARLSAQPQRKQWRKPPGVPWNLSSRVDGRKKAVQGGWEGRQLQSPRLPRTVAAGIGRRGLPAPTRGRRARWAQALRPFLPRPPHGGRPWPRPCSLPHCGCWCTRGAPATQELFLFLTRCVTRRHPKANSVVHTARWVVANDHPARWPPLPGHPRAAKASADPVVRVGTGGGRPRAPCFEGGPSKRAQGAHAPRQCEREKEKPTLAGARPAVAAAAAGSITHARVMDGRGATVSFLSVARLSAGLPEKERGSEGEACAVRSALFTPAKKKNKCLS